MSSRGSIMDRLVTLAEGAVAGLSAERGQETGTKLNTEQYPHLFVFEPVERDESIEFHQVERATDVQLRFLTKAEEQEAHYLKADAIRDAIFGDPTLNGLVRTATVSLSNPQEHPGEAVIESALTVSAEVFA